MENNQVSKSALITAFCRGYHARNDNPKIFNDFLSYDLFTEDERITLINTILQIGKTIDPITAATFKDNESALMWSMQQGSIVALTTSRLAYAENNLLETIKHGAKQYVILGAGMDTFAFRHLELQENLQVYELDHPATQTYKSNRINDLGWKTPSNLNYVPVDFTKDNLESAFSNSSFDSKKLTFFSLLGVSYYLTSEGLFDILRTITNISPKGSSIIFDYFETGLFAPNKNNQDVIKGSQKAGEPLKSGFNPSMLAEDIRSLGLRLHEDIGPTEIENRYFSGRLDNYHAAKNTHYAWVFVE